MDFNYLFIWVIFIPVLVLMIYVVKTIYDTSHLKKTINNNFIVLQKKILHENAKLEKNREKLLLVEDLHQTLFNRLFKITRDIILLQKLIFETRIK